MKSKFLNSIIILGSTVISVFNLSIGYKYVLAAVSSYQYSCPTELLQGVRLEANCWTTDRKNKPYSSLILEGIHVNSSGNLRQNALSGNSSFLNDKNCNSWSSQPYIIGGQIIAICKNRRYNYYKHTTIMLEEISNHNGQLTYEWDRIIDQTANKIMNHAFVSHYREFSLQNNTRSQHTMAAIAKDIMAACVPGASLYGHTFGIQNHQCKNLKYGRKIYWGEVVLPHYGLYNGSWTKGAVVIVNGLNDYDSTMFAPSSGISYYNRQR